MKSTKSRALTADARLESVRQVVITEGLHGVQLNFTGGLAERSSENHGPSGSR